MEQTSDNFENVIKKSSYFLHINLVNLFKKVHKIEFLSSKIKNQSNIIKTL